MSQMELYVGADWGTSETHLCVIDVDGSIVERAKVTDHIELLHALDRLRREHGRAQVALAIERRDLTLVDAALEAGYAVFTINPKLVDRFRDRFSAAGAKDDKRDALVLASSLRTDEHAFERVTPRPPEHLQLRGLHRFRSRLDKQRRLVANQLVGEVYRCFPQLLSLCAGADELWFLDLLEKLVAASTPAKVQRRVVEKILRQRRIRRHSAEDVVLLLKKPPPPVPEAIVDVAKLSIMAYVTQLKLLDKQMRATQDRLESQLQAMRAPHGENPTDVDLIRSVPGFGAITTAVMLGELGNVLVEGQLRRLRALTGVAPVTKRSGKAHVVQQRHACNPAARQALFHAALGALRDPHYRALYTAMRARGLGHARALRGLGDRLIRLLVAILRDRKPYDPAARGGPDQRKRSADEPSEISRPNLAPAA